MKMTPNETVFYEGLLALLKCGRALGLDRMRMVEILARVGEAMCEVFERQAARQAKPQ